MANVECLEEALGRLVAERQALHEQDADRNELESNRLELVGRQQLLTHALIDRYLPELTGRTSRPRARRPG